MARCSAMPSKRDLLKTLTHKEPVDVATYALTSKRNQRSSCTSNPQTGSVAAADQEAK